MSCFVPRRRLHSEAESKDWKLPRFASQQRLPLMTFTQCRIDALGLLGQGTLFQQAIFLAMARKVRMITNLLQRRAGTDPDVAAMIGDIPNRR
jgi:hypothetical protein